jgi:hypothetical protein
MSVAWRKKERKKKERKNILLDGLVQMLRVRASDDQLEREWKGSC